MITSNFSSILGSLNKKPTQPIPTAMPSPDAVFRFLSYYFDRSTYTATFVYQGIDNIIFTEKIFFAPKPGTNTSSFNLLDDPGLTQLLDQAMFLAFILIGTSYYKAHPTKNIRLDRPLDDFQARFFSTVFQEGLSQYAFENRLTRDKLATFKPTPGFQNKPAVEYRGQGVLALQSGGKDSLLVTELLNEHNINFVPWYISSSSDRSHPNVIDHLDDGFNHQKASVVYRQIDHLHLQQTGGLNGHVPVTFIVESLALIQAILNNQNVILTSIGREGEEPHAMIGDLPVNHQWSKTWQAEQLMTEYIKRYLSPDLHLGSPIRHLSELRIADLFVQKCWQKYGYSFSSCNEANYKQNNQNSTLKWCGHCAKCANSYLLFCPFIPPQFLQSLFGDKDLFLDQNLIQIFKGLLGVGGEMKPFECVGSVEELRSAYHHRMTTPPIPLPQSPGATQTTYWQPVYANLPFRVPESDFNYLAESNNQEYFRNFYTTYQSENTSEQIVAHNEQLAQSQQKADQILAMIERRKQLEQLKRSGRQRQRGLES
jgi:hypothetical protein